MSRRTVRAAPSMPPPPLPRDPSPSKRPGSSSAVPPSPSVAARVPLPPSPVKKAVPQTPPETPRTSQSATPKHLSGQSQLKSPPQFINDEYMQQSIAADMAMHMKGMSLNDRSAELSRPATPAASKQSGAVTPSLQRSPERQIFNPLVLESSQKSSSSRLAQQQQQALPTLVPSRSSQSIVSTKTATPKPQVTDAQLRSRQGSDADTRSRQGSDAQLRSRRSFESMQSSSSSSRPSSSSSMTAPPLMTQSQNESEITALSGVVIPALEAALHRRAYQLSLLQKSTNAQTKGAPSPQEMMQKRQAHEQIRRLVSKVGRLMRDIDHWDGVGPVGMGDGVEGFLEGVLEEILCRVEAEDA